MRKVSKYGAHRTVHSGYSFASKLEAAVFDYLKLLEHGGEIKDIHLQPNVMLTNANIRMIPDFKAFDIKLNQEVYFEAKGYETDVYRIKRRLWKFYGPAILRVYKGSAARLTLFEEIIPKVL